jgi:hypothetical protein
MEDIEYRIPQSQRFLVMLGVLMAHGLLFMINYQDLEQLQPIGLIPTIYYGYLEVRYIVQLHLRRNQ